MSFLKLGLSVPHLHCNHLVLNTLLCPTLGYVVEHSPLHPNPLHSGCHTPVHRSTSPSYTFAPSFLRRSEIGSFQISVDGGEATGFAKPFLSKNGLHSPGKLGKLPSSRNIQLDVYPKSDEIPIEPRVKQRNLKNHGNKGKIPWNKGRKHTAETCALIKHRTIEALKDPKVRKRMSEHRLAHSEANKAKISSSLRLVWAKRLKWKRLGENLFFSWRESLAKAAKTGGYDEEELEWNSYDKIIQELTIQQLQCTAVREKSKKLSKIKVEGRPLGKEKMVRIDQRGQERDEKAIEETRGKRCRKENKNADKSLFPRERTLKQRLKKIRRKVSIRVGVSGEAALPISYNPAWKKLDLDIMEIENGHKKVSLADQIQAAKSTSERENSASINSSVSGDSS